MQPDKVWKAVSVYKFIFPVVSFPPPPFIFSAEIKYIEVAASVRWRASEEKLNMFTEKKGEHSHH